LKFLFREGLFVNRNVFLAVTCVALLVVSIPQNIAAEVRSYSIAPRHGIKNPISYNVYLPPNYSYGSREYPVLYLLHGGATGKPSDWFTLAGIDQILDGMILSGEIRPLIAVSPDGRSDEKNEIATYFLNDADGSRLWENDFIDRFIPLIESRYRVIKDANSRAILGISMGGMAAAIYQLRYPDNFAGIAALSASFRTDEQLLTLSTSDYKTRYDSVLGPDLYGEDRLTQEWEDLRPHSLVRATDMSRFSRIPRLYFDIGADDPFFEGAAALHIAFRDAGLRHRFRVSEGSHDWPFWRHAIPEALRHINAVLTRGYGE
jgi:enterochelin esterase-like enzyme